MLRKILPAFMLLAVTVMAFAFTPVKKEIRTLTEQGAVITGGGWQLGDPTDPEVCPDGNTLCGVVYQSTDFASPSAAGAAAANAKAAGAQHGIPFQVSPGVFITIYEKL